MQKEQNYGSATANIGNIDKVAPNDFTPTEAVEYTEELKDASAEVKQRYHFYGSVSEIIPGYSNSPILLGNANAPNGDVGDIIYAESRC